jgi:DNA-binding response OmpR family regulator
MDLRVLYHGTDVYACRFIHASLELTCDSLLVESSGVVQTTTEYLESARWDLLVIDGRNDESDATPVLVRSLRQVAELVPLFVFAPHGASVLDEILALRAGADDWVIFPLPQAQFAARCNALLRRVARPDSISKLETHGSLKFDESLHELTGPHDTLSLTCTEARILACLLRRQGRYVSIAELLGEVWDSGPAVGRERVKVGVYRLRQKLLLAGIDSSVIEYHRGMGYRVNLPKA